MQTLMDRHQTEQRRTCRNTYLRLWIWLSGFESLPPSQKHFCSFSSSFPTIRTTNPPGLPKENYAVDSRGPASLVITHNSQRAWVETTELNEVEVINDLAI